MKPICCYRSYSLIIGSELPLPGLPTAEGQPDVLIRFGKIPRVRRQASLNDELAFHGLAGAFHISRGQEIVIDPLPGADPEVVQVVLLGRIMAFLLRQRGWLSLHASAVFVNRCAVLFLGTSGAGKSTLAAALHAAGHHVLTDDVAPVRICEGRCITIPVRQGLRLDDRSRFLVRDAAGVPEWDKYRVDLTRGALPDSVPVRCIYELVDSEEDEIVSTHVSLSDSVRYLSAHSFFKRRKMDETSLQAHLRDCAAVAGGTSVRRLARPRRLDALPAVVQFIEQETLQDG